MHKIGHAAGLHPRPAAPSPARRAPARRLRTPLRRPRRQRPARPPPELDRALDYLRPGDQLVITKLDRVGRWVRHLIELAGQFAARDVDLVVLHQAIDTTTPGGRLFFHLLAAFAQFEADLASERTRDGLEAARARGRAGGRRPKLNPRQLALARQLYDPREHTVQAIAET